MIFKNNFDEAFDNHVKFAHKRLLHCFIYEEGGIFVVTGSTITDANTLIAKLINQILYDDGIDTGDIMPINGSLCNCVMRLATLSEGNWAVFLPDEKNNETENISNETMETLLQMVYKKHLVVIIANAVNNDYDVSPVIRIAAHKLWTHDYFRFKYEKMNINNDESDRIKHLENDEDVNLLKEV